MDKFDFNTLPDYTDVPNRLSLLKERDKLKARIKELEERILSLELDLEKHKGPFIKGFLNDTLEKKGPPNYKENW